MTDQMTEEQMTEDQMVEGMARSLFEAREVAMCPDPADRMDWSDAYCKTWVAEGWAALAYIRAHAGPVCRLLGGAGPEEVGRVREFLTDMPNFCRDDPCWTEACQEAAELAAALGGKEKPK